MTTTLDKLLDIARKRDEAGQLAAKLRECDVTAYAAAHGLDAVALAVEVERLADGCRNLRDVLSESLRAIPPGDVK